MSYFYFSANNCRCLLSCLKYNETINHKNALQLKTQHKWTNLLLKRFPTSMDLLRLKSWHPYSFAAWHLVLTAMNLQTSKQKLTTCINIWLICVNFYAHWVKTCLIVSKSVNWISSQVFVNHLDLEFVMLTSWFDDRLGWQHLNTIFRLPVYGFAIVTLL